MKREFHLIIGLALGALLFGLVGGAMALRLGSVETVQRSAATSAVLDAAFTFQGQLKDGAGPANGQFDLRFRLFDAAASGSQVGSTITRQDEAVSEGLFTVSLDFGMVYDGTALWLEVAVRPGSSSGAFDVLSPRNPLTATPYAIHALSAWNVNGNSSTDPAVNFLGTSDDAALTIKVDDTVALRLEPASNQSFGARPNVIGGSDSNSAASGVVGAAIGGGSGNTAGSSMASVGGGLDNTAGGEYGTIAGGHGNDIFNTTTHSVIGGGSSNVINGSAWAATIGGGNSNSTGATQATVGGGNSNSASGFLATVGGGQDNIASGTAAAVSGGDDNSAAGSYSNISGGQQNSASADNASIGGGGSNSAGGNSSTVGGGQSNQASGLASTVSGGFINDSGAQQATIGGGVLNDAGGLVSTIGGGQQNIAAGNWSTIGGGLKNTASGYQGTVSGGHDNLISSTVNYGTISGGINHIITGTGSAVTIGGGINNSASDSGATVAGGQSNTASGQSATVSGGSGNEANYTRSTIGGGQGNVASSDSATVSGGINNIAEAAWTTIGGGRDNVASGQFNTVGGGDSNKIALGSYGTIPGGSENYVGNWYGFAAGYRARVEHFGAFVWADSTGAVFTSTANNQYLIRAAGGVGIGTNSPSHPPEMASGAHVTAGGAWTNASSQALKENFEQLDAQAVLEEAAALPVTRWNYRETPSVTHIGPTAEAFQAAFNLGDGRHISTADADGVALAAIQGLYENSQQQEAVIADLQAQNDELSARLTSLEEAAGIKQDSGHTFGFGQLPLLLLAVPPLIVYASHGRRKEGLSQ